MINVCTSKWQSYQSELRKSKLLLYPKGRKTFPSSGISELKNEGYSSELIFRIFFTSEIVGLSFRYLSYHCNSLVVAPLTFILIQTQIMPFQFRFFFPYLGNPTSTQLSEQCNSSFSFSVSKVVTYIVNTFPPQ